MRRVRTKWVVTGLSLTLAAIAATGCKPDPKDCYEKGDEKACNTLCGSGGQEFEAACYEMRARSVLACADGKADCTQACTYWKNAQISAENVKNIYVAKLGSEAKVAAVNKACAGK